MRMAKTARRGYDGVYEAKRWMPSSSVNDYATKSMGPGTLTDGLDLLTRTSASFVLFATLLTLLVFFLYVVYFILVCIRRGFWAAIEMIDSFLQDKEVLQRIHALDLFIPLTGTKTGSLHEALMSSQAVTVKIGELSANPPPRVSRTLPAVLFSNTVDSNNSVKAVSPDNGKSH